MNITNGDMIGQLRLDMMRSAMLNHGVHGDLSADFKWDGDAIITEVYDGVPMDMFNILASLEWLKEVTNNDRITFSVSRSNKYEQYGISVGECFIIKIVF